MAVDYAVIVVYPAGMLGMGWWGVRRAKSKSEFLVAGRRLGPWMYSGTMAAIVLGGAIVVAYSTLGGMWSITLTDMVQFVVKTIGVLLLLLPMAVVKAGGFSEMKAALPTEYFTPLGIGGETIFTYVLIYTFGMLIGQDIWQRVFTARSDKVARYGGTYTAEPYTAKVV